MAVLVVNEAFSFLEEYFYETDSYIVTPTLAIFQTPEGYIQHFRGNNLDSDPYTITGISTYSSVGELLVNVELNIPGHVYDAYSSTNDAFGLWGYALQGNDSLIGSMENDYLIGFAGNDFITARMGNDTVLGHLGTDTVRGGKGSDSLRGGAGDDLLYGDFDNDVVSGELGNDLQRGGRGDDTLSGGEGNDTLYGDLGNDILTGNAGADIFAFLSGSGTDVISDFQDGIDRIQVASSLFATGNDAAAAFSGGVLHLDSDNSVTLTGILSLGAEDFIISG